MEDSPIKLRTPDELQVTPDIATLTSLVELGIGISQVPIGTISSPNSASRTCKTTPV